eukprot:CAMPEP_0115081184 /NCGR_PEP_ID=MMETSP0227-20121206/19113_1 /TAXON_ID=89957 /ORGANISM="Polarella glacialis, Strain CCMP 1383" /LENGTH=793 /DNA_ID=CAMNT_0002468951 /DNA_START=74 /DNA_END=2459 /DNA_ORIENTATION=-
MSSTWPPPLASSAAVHSSEEAPDPQRRDRSGGLPTFNTLARRLTRAREAALAKASWRPAKARATPVISIAKASPAKDPYDVAASPDLQPSRGAKPPLLPGSAGSPQRKQQPSLHACCCTHSSLPTEAQVLATAETFVSDSELTVLHRQGPRQAAQTGPQFPRIAGLRAESAVASSMERRSAEDPRPSSAWSPPHQLHRTGGNRQENLRRIKGTAVSSATGPPVLDAIREVFCLYASPLDHPPINVRSEVETLRDAFAESGSRVALKVGVATAASLIKLLTLAKARKGLVLHLSAHAIISDKGEPGLVLEDARGAAHVLWRQSLEEILGIREQGLRNVSLLFLSTCWSEELAQVFVECGCRHVVALRSRVHDAAARRFSQQFYLSLGVGEPLLAAWESARTALRVEAERELVEQAEHFVLFGQHGSDEAMLRDLCGSEEQSSDGSPTMREVEDVSLFLDMKVPPRPEHFVGRTQVIYEVLHVFGGLHGRRACTVHGPEGIGKSALGVEIAHFAAAPGRLFSCAVRVLRLESMEPSGFTAAIEDELESLAIQLGVVLRPSSGDSRTSLASSWHSQPGSLRRTSFESSRGDADWGSEPSSSSLSLPTPVTSNDADSLAFLVPERQRIRRGFQQIERSRRGQKILLVVDDEVGAVGSSNDIHKLLGELLEHTHQLHVLICTRAPIYRSLGTTKVVNVPLKGLGEAEAAKLFLQRIHRPLSHLDFLVQGQTAATAVAGLPAICKNNHGVNHPSAERPPASGPPRWTPWADPGSELLRNPRRAYLLQLSRFTEDQLKMA